MSYQSSQSLPSQFMYYLIINNIAPVLASSAYNLYSSYFTRTNIPSINMIKDKEPDDEREVDLLQMDRLLKWMSLIFEGTSTSDRERQYKQELYNIYCTISSDYKQYENLKQYNSGIWVLSSYRKKDVKAIAKKILSDVKLFNEGMKMFQLFQK